jgi:hypothetical protein
MKKKAAPFEITRAAQAMVAIPSGIKPLEEKYDEASNTEPGLIPCTLGPERVFLSSNTW